MDPRLLYIPWTRHNPPRGLDSVEWIIPSTPILAIQGTH